ncbi:TCB2 [Hepatospora eriocheir]|uniref:TCB2 n=1 Tax=Hepatospora eriocheir TaxID=1081669 RepID=A0A1X0QBN8_9MICR|nr:TCB2 [Hepatospora eriocheir]
MSEQIREEHSETNKRLKKDNELTNNLLNNRSLIKKESNEKINKESNILSNENKKIHSALDYNPTHSLFKLMKINGVFLLTSIVGYFIGKYKLKPFYLFLLSYLFYLVFSQRVNQYKLSIKNYFRGVKRYESVDKSETVEWLNYIIRQFWKVSEAPISSEIHSNVNEVLRKLEVSGIKGLRLTECTLGTFPPEVDYISFYERKDDALAIEFSLSFIPLQDEITQENNQDKYNSCIQVNADINNFISLPFLVRNLTFSAKFRVELYLKREIPMLKTLKLQMLELPTVDFVLIPLKMFDITKLPGISGIITNVINEQVTNLLLKPKFMEVNLDGVAEYQGKRIGIVCVELHKLITDDDSSKYVTLDINGTDVHKTNSYDGHNPIINESFFIIIKDTTTKIGITLHESNNKFGSIYLRNLNRHFFNEILYLVSPESTSLLYTTTTFYPLTNVRQQSGILNINVINITNLSKYNDTSLYNTYLILKTVEISTKKEIF